MIEIKCAMINPGHRRLILSVFSSHNAKLPLKASGTVCKARANHGVSLVKLASSVTNGEVQNRCLLSILNRPIVGKLSDSVVPSMRRGNSAPIILLEAYAS